jgi:outer membrane protein assembly factor BamB
MRSDDGTPCAACGAVWDRRARYCGVCGAAFVAAAVPPPQAAADGRSRRRLLLGGGLAAVAVLLALATWFPGRSPSGPASADSEVALPGPGELPGRPPSEGSDDRPAADGEEGGPPAAPDVAAPVCDPVGCEVWRRSLAHPIDGLSLGPDRLFYLQDSTVIALDRASGVIRWRRPLDQAVRADDGPGRPQPWASALVAGDDSRVVVATSRGVQLTSHDGRPAWAVPLPVDGLVVDLQLADDVVLVVHEVLGPDQPSEDGEAGGGAVAAPLRAIALSATDGTVRWERNLPGQVVTQSDLGGPHELLLAPVDGELVALELATGQPRFTVPAQESSAGAQLVGRYLLLAGDQDAALRVVATRDGSLLAELSGWPRHTAEVDGRLIAIVGRDDPGASQPRYEAVAVTPDGAIAWTRPLAAADVCCGCCPSLLDLGAGRLRIAADPRAEAQVVAAATGEVLWRDPLALGPGEVDAADQWQVGDGLLISSPEGGDGGYTLFDPTGHRLHVRRGFWPLPEQPNPERNDGLALLASDSELVAVRFP